MGGPVDQSVSAGFGAFVATFLLACALWLLMRNMNTRLRNLKYREEAEQERLRQEGEGVVAARPAAAGERPPQASGEVTDDAGPRPASSGPPDEGQEGDERRAR